MPHRSGTTNCLFLTELKQASSVLSSANTETSSKAGPRNCYMIWKMVHNYHLLNTQKVPGFLQCPLPQSIPFYPHKTIRNVLFFYLGDDDLGHIEMACVTLSKLLNQQWDGCKARFISPTGQSLNRYVASSLWFEPSSGPALLTASLGSLMASCLLRSLTPAAVQPAHCWPLALTSLAARPHCCEATPSSLWQPPLPSLGLMDP